MTATWHCEGCGAHVIDVSRDTPPGHQWCAPCQWLNLYLSDDPGEFWAAYLRLRDGIRLAPGRPGSPGNIGC